MENETNRIDCDFFHGGSRLDDYWANYYAGLTIINFWKRNNPTLANDEEVYLGICTELFRFVDSETQETTGWEIVPIVRMWRRSSESEELETVYRTRDMEPGKVLTTGDGKLLEVEELVRMLDGEAGLERFDARTIEIIGVSGS